MTAVDAVRGRRSRAVGALARSLQVLRSDRGLLVGVVLFVAIVLLALLGPLVVRTDPFQTSAEVLLGPSWDHLLGTDSVGRDLLARVIGGLRYSLQVVILATAGTALIGISLGLLAGYLGGRTDWIAMRVTDVLLAIPSLMVAIAAIASFGAGLRVLVLVLVVTFVSLALRVARAAAMQLRERDYVLSARLSKVGTARILWIHVFPNSRATLLVQTTLTAALVLLIETSLSFLGLGAQSPAPSLGGMIADGRTWMEVSPHVILVPTAVVIALISSITAIGNGLDRVLARQTAR